MRRVFLLTYDDNLGTREQIKQALNNNNLVMTWRYDLPHCFYIVSESSARILAESIRKYFPDGRLLVTRADDDYWGWNNEDTWFMFRNKYIK